MIDFTATILQEDAPPSTYSALHDPCELAQQTKRVIWGEGNPAASIFILLDNPGLREDKEGHPFLCGTRETLQLGLYHAGIDVNCVYISFLLKRRPIRAYDKPLARQRGLIHLHQQLDKMKPKLLFGLGDVVVQALYSEQEAAVKTFRGKWHMYKGIPAAFSYHPLAVRRRPNLMPYFVEDLKMITDMR